MGDQARPLAPAAPADNVAPLPGVLEAVIRALAGALTTGGTRPATSADPAVDKPLLDLEETAGLLGVSRMTVARMADEGRAAIGGHPPGAGAENTPDPTGIRGPDSRGRVRWRRGGLGRVCGCLAR
jgi:hypothetical protein